MHLFCPAREMGGNQAFLEQDSVCVLQVETSPLLPDGALQTCFTLTAVGVFLLFWHRGTNETSEPSWGAAVSTGTAETVAERGGIIHSTTCVQ